MKRPGISFEEDPALEAPKPEEFAISSDGIRVEAPGHEKHELMRIEKSPTASSGVAAFCGCGRRFFIRRRFPGEGSG